MKKKLLGINKQLLEFCNNFLAALILILATVLVFYIFNKSLLLSLALFLLFIRFEYFDLIYKYKKNSSLLKILKLIIYLIIILYFISYIYQLFNHTYEARYLMSYTLLLMSIVSIIARKIKPTNETIEDKNINCVSDKLLILSTKTNVKTKNSILIYLYKRLLSFILLFIGKLCHSLGDFNTAINYYCKIINIGVGRYQSSYYYIALCYFFLEKNYSYNGGYEKAIEYYEKGFNLYPKFVSISPIYFFSFISICEEQKRWDLIIKYQDLITEDIKNTFFVSSFIKVECGSFYGSMARSYYYSDIPYALINLEKYINIDKLNRMFNYFNVAEDFRKNNNADKAFEYYNKALEVRRSDFKKMKKESYMDNYWVLLYIGYLFKYEDNIEYWQNNLNESYDKEYLYNRSYAAQDKAA